MSNNTIQVVIRVRPLIEREINSGCQNILKKISDHEISIAGDKNRVFTFDHVFSETDNQEKVYQNSVHHLIKQFLEGYNVTIFAYGQSGSGKTHTLDINYNGFPSEAMGVIPRTIIEIFKCIGKMKGEHDINVKCCFVELFNEKVFDLFSNIQNRDSCIGDTCEGSTKETCLPSVTEIEVSSIEEIVSCLVKGSSARAVGAPAMNSRPSRSHAIFTVIIEVMKKENPILKTCSRFNLVDLAGSERSKKSKATGNWLKGGIKINQGLFALGKWIAALNASNSASFESYRESKLTHLLQDSLGANSVTLLIACISPADLNMDETINTLSYANRGDIFKSKSVDDDNVEQEVNGLEADCNDLLPPEINSGGIKQENVKNDNFIMNMEFNKILSPERTDKERFNMLKTKILKTYAEVKYINSTATKNNKGKADGMPVKSQIKAIFEYVEMEINFEHLKQQRDGVVWVVESLTQENPFNFEFASDAEIELNKLNKEITTCQKSIYAAQESAFNKLVTSAQSVEDERNIVKCLFQIVLFLNKMISEYDQESFLLTRSYHKSLIKVKLLEIEGIIQKELADVNFIEQANKEKIELLECYRNTTNYCKITEEISKHKTKYLEMKYEFEYENEQLMKQLKFLQENAIQSESDEADEGDIEIDMFGDIIGHDLWTEEKVVTRRRSQYLKKMFGLNTFDVLKKHEQRIKQLIQCHCTKGCANKRCNCRKNSLTCKDNCKCNKLCTNSMKTRKQNYVEETETQKSSVNVLNTTLNDDLFNLDSNNNDMKSLDSEANTDEMANVYVTKVDQVVDRM